MGRESWRHKEQIMAKEKKDIFKKLVGLEGGNKRWRLSEPSTKDSEKWIHHILSADREAPKIESDRNIKPFVIMGVTCFLLLSLMLGRAAYLQIFQGSQHKILAEENRNRGNIIRAPRGIIYDKNHMKLVKNTPNYEATIIPSELPKDEREKKNVISEAAKALNIPAEEI